MAGTIAFLIEHVLPLLATILGVAKYNDIRKLIKAAIFAMSRRRGATRAGLGTTANRLIDAVSMTIAAPVFAFLLLLSLSPLTGFNPIDGVVMLWDRHMTGTCFSQTAYDDLPKDRAALTAYLEACGASGGPYVEDARKRLAAIEAANRKVALDCIKDTALQRQCAFAACLGAYEFDGTPLSHMPELKAQAAAYGKSCEAPPGPCSEAALSEVLGTGDDAKIRRFALVCESEPAAAKAANWLEDRLVAAAGTCLAAAAARGDCRPAGCLQDYLDRSVGQARRADVEAKLQARRDAPECHRHPTVARVVVTTPNAGTPQHYRDGRVAGLLRDALRRAGYTVPAAAPAEPDPGTLILAIDDAGSWYARITAETTPPPNPRSIWVASVTARLRLYWSDRTDAVEDHTTTATGKATDQDAAHDRAEEQAAVDIATGFKTIVAPLLDPH